MDTLDKISNVVERLNSTSKNNESAGKPYLIVMCGLQCSGKSTRAQELSKTLNAVVLSSDEFRVENPTFDNNQIFSLLYKSVNELLSIEKNVIIDATNITIKSRKQIFCNIKPNCWKICYIMNTPYGVCLERLKDRNMRNPQHFVPEEILKRYYFSFEVPFYEEGWDDIIIDKSIELDKAIRYIIKTQKECKDFNQKTKWHNESLGEHLQTTFEKLNELVEKQKTNTKNKEELANLLSASLYHDIGKLYTQTFKENDENAHYYNHANVGAYELLCNMGIYTLGGEYQEKETLNFVFYVNYHMKPFDWKAIKTNKKYIELFGYNKYENLLLLNLADTFRTK